MEAEWSADRANLRLALRDHSDWSVPQLAQQIGRSVSWPNPNIRAMKCKVVGPHSGPGQRGTGSAGVGNDLSSRYLPGQTHGGQRAVAGLTPLAWIGRIAAGEGLQRRHGQGRAELL